MSALYSHDRKYVNPTKDALKVKNHYSMGADLNQGRSWHGFHGFGRTLQFSKMGSQTHQFLRKFNRNSAF